MNGAIPTHAAKAVIRNESGEILFLQRNPATGAKPNWDLPGGLVEADESDKEALTREIQEELGTKTLVGDEIGKWSFFRALDGATVEVTNYETTLTEDVPFTLSDEHIASKWVPEENVSELDIKDKSLLNALSR